MNIVIGEGNFDQVALEAAIRCFEFLGIKDFPFWVRSYEQAPGNHVGQRLIHCVVGDFPFEVEVSIQGIGAHTRRTQLYSVMWVRMRTPSESGRGKRQFEFRFDLGRIVTITGGFPKEFRLSESWNEYLWRVLSSWCRRRLFNLRGLFRG